MIDFTKKPFYLKEEQINQINQMYKEMSLQEKIGQLFCPIGSSFEEQDIKEFIETYQPGGLMYRPMESANMRTIHEIAQKTSKYPLLLAANLESGGNGICSDGTYFSRQMGVAATGDVNQAYRLGEIAGKEANAVGCNWSFAPIVDIDYNYLNPITNIRTYGSHPETVLSFAKKQIEALQENHILPCIKHFPGDGVDLRDQHILSSVNDLTVEQWDATYGHIYSTLIEAGVGSIMVGHILLPNYVKRFHPEIADADILPSSMAKEILTNLLREQLNFQGLIVTDATAMLGYTCALPRSEAIPLTIEHGCDMILFNKDIKEDYAYMYQGIQSGILSQKRLEEAVLRIFATKMANGLFEPFSYLNELTVVGCGKHQELAEVCASQAITLVKEEADVLPLSVKKYPRIRLYQLTDTATGGFAETGGSETLETQLRQLGFHVDVYDQNHLDFHEIFETGVSYIKERYDLVIYVANFDTASNQTTRRLEWVKLMAANAPWFVQEVKTIFISLANPYHLLDVPMIKTYINCYSQNDATMKALVKKIMGQEAFVGTSPVDPFCGKWDAKR